MTSPVSGGGTAMMQQMREQIFARVDTDRSGGVSFSEFQTARQNVPGRAEESAALGAFTRFKAQRDGTTGTGAARFSEGNLARLLGQQEARPSANPGLQLQQAMQRSLEAYGRQGGETGPRLDVNRLGVSLAQG